MSRLRQLLVSALAIGALSASAHAAEVTIYRCTDAKNHLTLRDTPCRSGEKQETRAMVRPQDAPPRPVVEAAVPAAPREPAPRYIVLTPPRPLYECISPDGERYTSQTAEGRPPRWEPYLSPGLAWPYPRDPYSGGYSANIGYRGNHVRGNIRIGEPYPRPMPAPVPTYPVPVYAGGTWVRDECNPLPQAEVCDRLRDQRYELNRRWNIAQPSERAQIDRDTRGIDAQLNNDCGGR
ncbi:DUF4124 domain-containing protein [Lysobacter fragariae]